MASLTDWIPAISNGIGAFSGAGMNLFAQYMQNEQQEYFYNRYMSPQARMVQMKAAGINPNAAAQGISGASAPQMNAAAPTGAFTGFGEQLGNTVMSAYDAALKKSETKKNNSDAKVADTIAEGNEINNKFNFETFETRVKSLSLDNEQKQYIIDTMRPYAENAEEWYKINFRNLDEKANLMKKQMDEIDEKMKNLRKEREVMELQKGKIEADTWYSNSMAELNEQKKRLVDELGGEDVESAYIIAKAKGEDKKADAIKTGVEEYNKASESGTVSGSVETDPVERTKQTLTERYEKEAGELQSDIDSLRSQLREYTSGRKKDNYFGTNRSNLEYQLKSAENRLRNLTDKYHKDLRRYSSNESVSVGLHGVSRSK